MTASFSSPFDPAAFSIQNQNTTFLTLSQFSGNYLYQNRTLKTPVHIKFSQTMTRVNLAFATSDYHGVGEVDVPTDVILTAYMDSTGTPQVGSATTHGTFSTDSFPQGALQFDSGGQPFNLITIEMSPRLAGGSSFMLDNITVTTAP